MRVSAAVCVVVVVVMAVCTSAQQQRPQVPVAIQKLRAPLINLPLKDLFENMQSANTVDFYVKCVLGEGRCTNVGAALRHLLVDLKPHQQLCYGCSSCEVERVKYVLSVMKEKYPNQACKIQNALKRPVFDGGNPCV